MITERESMEPEDGRKAAIKFFEEAISKWRKFIFLSNLAVKGNATDSTVTEAGKILDWFQENYPLFQDYSDFKIHVTSDEGKTVEVDPIFDVIFGASNFTNLIRNYRSYVSELNQIDPALRAHLASVRSKSRAASTEKLESSLARVLRIINRFHLAAIQLRTRRKSKSGFQIP